MTTNYVHLTVRSAVAIVLCRAACVRGPTRCKPVLLLELANTRREWIGEAAGRNSTWRSLASTRKTRSEHKLRNAASSLLVYAAPGTQEQRFSRRSLLPTLHKKLVRNEARFVKMLQKRLSEQVNATVLLLPMDAGYTTQTEKRQAQAQQEQRRREREDTNGTRRRKE